MDNGEDVYRFWFKKFFVSDFLFTIKFIKFHSETRITYKNPNILNPYLILSKMKTPNLFLLLFAISAILISSCKEDENDARDKFVGSYSMSETWTLDGGGSGTDNYTISITKSDVSSKQILINNLGNTITAYGAQMNVTASVEGSSISIGTQSISLGDYSVTVTGTGSLNDKLLTINYVIVGQWQGQLSGFKQ
jgi:hypothetical protein